MKDQIIAYKYSIDGVSCYIPPSLTIQEVIVLTDIRWQALRIVMKRDYRSERISMFLFMEIRRAKVKRLKDIYI